MSLTLGTWWIRERGKCCWHKKRDNSLSFRLVLIHHSLHTSFLIKISGTPDQTTVSICLLEHHTGPIPNHCHKIQWWQKSDGPTWNNSIFQHSAKIYEGYSKYFFETELLRKQNSPNVVFKLTSCVCEKHVLFSLQEKLKYKVIISSPQCWWKTR